MGILDSRRQAAGEAYVFKGWQAAGLGPDPFFSATLFQAGEACVLKGWGNLHKMHRSPSSTREDRPATSPPLCNAAAVSAVRESNNTSIPSPSASTTSIAIRSSRFYTLNLALTLDRPSSCVWDQAPLNSFTAFSDTLPLSLSSICPRLKCVFKILPLLWLPTFPTQQRPLPSSTSILQSHPIRTSAA